MKVLQICKSLNTALGGIQTHTRSLCTHLVRQGVSVDVLTGGSWKEQALPEIEGVRVIPMRYLPGYRLRGLRRLGDDLAFNLQALTWLFRHQKEYDLIHVQGRSGLLFAASNLKRRPVVITFHGLTREEYRHARARQAQSFDSWLHQYLTHPWEKRAYRQADGVITVSSFMAGQLEALFGPRRRGLSVISNGVTLSPLSQETDSEQPTKQAVHSLQAAQHGTEILSKEPSISPAPVWNGGPSDPQSHGGKKWITFLGRMEENKGVRLLPDLMEQLPEDLRLRLIGTGKLLPWLRKEMAKRNLTHRVDWIGPIPNEQVRDQLLGSMALLVPSLYEPQGLVVLEAFERGVPVLASAVGGMREMVRPGENGWLLPPNDLNSLINHIRELYEYPALARNLGMQGRRMVETHYQWASIAGQTLAMYQSICSA